MVKRHKKNVGLLDINLCSGCGFCAAICPSTAISLIVRNGFYKVNVDEDKCTGCKLCLKICPRISNFDQSNSGLDHTKYNPLIGHYLAVFLCHASDYKLRFNASSGGCATALLAYMLDKGLIDEAIIVVPDEKELMYAKAVATSDTNTIRKSIGSKYTQVYMIDAIKRILMFRNKRFALVGLPCHIRALRNIERTLKLRNITIRLGLYCGNLPSAWASEFLTYLYRFPKDRVKRISYRGLGWPGYLTIELVNGDKLCVPEPLYWRTGFGRYFYNTCCVLCSDHTNELADISFADPAGVEEVANDRLGHTLIVVRSRAGLKLLKAAERDGYITLKKIPDKYAIQGTTILKKINKTQDMVYKLLKVSQRPRYEYSLSFQFPIFMWLIDYLIGHKLAMNKKYWIFIPVWRRLSEIALLLLKIMLRKNLRRCWYNSCS